MKYIITERQFKIINENKKSGIQSLIDYYLENIKNECEDENSELLICDFIDSIDSIEVEKIEYKNNESDKILVTPKIYLIFNYFGHRDPDDEIFDFFSIYLNPYLEKTIGCKFSLYWKSKPMITPY